MSAYKLTSKQKKFLERVKDEHPFCTFNYTIPIIIQEEQYTEDDRKIINRCIKLWMNRDEYK